MKSNLQRRLWFSRVKKERPLTEADARSLCGSTLSLSGNGAESIPSMEISKRPEGS
jgi:hypothetical protein